jgi:hypothetical protein
MKRFQLVDGAIRHGDLVLDARLHGEDRARAHAELLLCADPSPRANGRKAELDQRFAAILRHDPSLLLETIPTRYPLQRTQAQAWANADPVWKNMSTWFGTWVRKALDVDCDLAVAAALEHGIHPDDPDVWPEGTLLATDHWSTTPSRLELALRHGARPDRGVEDWSDGYLYKALGEVRGNIGAQSGTVSEQALLNGVRCTHMLLDAGALVVDPPVPAAKAPGEMNLGAKLLTSIGLLTDGNGALMGQPHIRAAVFDLATRLQQAGADIDRRCGVSEVPPVVMALRCLNIEFACHLVRVGCRTDDESIVRTSGFGGHIAPLLDEAQKAGGDAFRAQLLAATMERQMLACKAARAAGANEGQAPPVARRRRLAAI